MIAALYVERGGPYFDRLDVDPWDKERDARLYAGPYPVVAHPPCGPWGHLSHLYRGDEHDCAPRAVEQVRGWGGVLEHPARSRLWKHAGLPMPGEPMDAYGGYSLEVCQVDWGHVARKRTWLYLVGVPRDAVPPGIKVCSAQQRRRTPPQFADWLIALARESQIARAA